MSACLVHRMILPTNPLQSSNLSGITSENRSNPHTNSDSNHFVGIIQSTTTKPDSVHLDPSNAYQKQEFTSLGYPEALAGQSNSSVTQIPNTTTQFVLNTTHPTMANNIVSALMDEKIEQDHAAHNRIMLLVLIGIFMFISIFITMVVIVMCKKKNSVFMLQKCEQESDLELDEIDEANTDTSGSEYEQLDSNTDHRRSESYPCLGKLKYMDECLEDRGSLKHNLDIEQLNNSWTNMELELQSNVESNMELKLQSNVESNMELELQSNVELELQSNIELELHPSTPLLYSLNSGSQTASNDTSEEAASDGNISEHSLGDKQTGSVSTEKYVICLDKFSIHSQQRTDSSPKVSTSPEKSDKSRKRPKLTKSQTVDLCIMRKTRLSHRERSTRWEKWSQQQQAGKQSKQCSSPTSKSSKSSHRKQNYEIQPPDTNCGNHGNKIDIFQTLATDMEADSVKASVTPGHIPGDSGYLCGSPVTSETPGDSGYLCGLSVTSETPGDSGYLCGLSVTSETPSHHSRGGNSVVQDKAVPQSD